MLPNKIKNKLKICKAVLYFPNIETSIFFTSGKLDAYSLRPEIKISLNIIK